MCLITSPSATAQGPLPEAKKFDEFGSLSTDDVQARLDLFAEQLRLNDKLRGFVVGYRSKTELPGSHLRKIFGYLDYLANSRGINPANLEVLDGGPAGKDATELWLAPPGANKPASPVSARFSAPMRYDEVHTGANCEPEYTIELYEPWDALQFFASELANDPDLKGLLVVHPSSPRADRRALRLLNNSKTELLNRFNVPRDRLMTELQGQRACTTMTLWLVPSKFSRLVGITAEDQLSSQIMSEGEKNRYTVRRLVFVGNTWTRDSILRKQTHELREGEIFSVSTLRHSLKNLSRLRSIYPVRIGDVDAYLNPEDSTIDITINVRPRSRERR